MAGWRNTLSLQHKPISETIVDQVINGHCQSRGTKEKALSFDKAFTGEFGRCERIRTSDPLHPMQMRYLAALHTDGVSSADGGRVYGDDPALSTRKREQNPVYGAFACFTNDQRLKVSRLPKIPSLT